MVFQITQGRKFNDNGLHINMLQCSLVDNTELAHLNLSLLKLWHRVESWKWLTSQINCSLRHSSSTTLCLFKPARVLSSFGRLSQRITHWIFSGNVSVREKTCFSVTSYDPDLVSFKKKLWRLFKRKRSVCKWFVMNPAGKAFCSNTHLFYYVNSACVWKPVVTVCLSDYL